MFSNIRKSLGLYFSPRKNTRSPPWKDALPEAGLLDNPPLLSTNLKAPKSHTRVKITPLDLEANALQVEPGTSKKRRALTTSLQGTAKRRKREDHGYKDVNENEDSDFEASKIMSSAPATRTKISGKSSKAATDRALMPPPATPKRARLRLSTAQSGSCEDNSELDSGAPGSANRRKADVFDDFGTELSRRNANAVQLPANSGIWAEAEKDLFYHLALRGLESLVPNNWMPDFKTLPLSLFARDGTAPPLISVNHEAEFRAIRALRDLIDLGQDVRDGALAIGRRRPEPIIGRGVRKYLSWALRDVGMHRSQRPGVIPVYAIATMKKAQTTQDPIRQLTADLHKLAARWRRAHNIRESIEARSVTPISNNEETQVAEEEDDDLPILTGIIICSSVMMIVTLNAHTLPPPSLRLDTDYKRQMISPRSSSEQESIDPQRTAEAQPETATAIAAGEDSGLRVIATFDFSDVGHDVWNALSVAIVAMCVRKTMVTQFEQASRTGRGKMWETTDQRGPSEKSWDPDA